MIFNEKSLIFDPCFCAKRQVCEFAPKWPIKLYLGPVLKRPVATGLGPVFPISQNPGNRNRTDHQRAWTATAVRSFFSPVQFGLRSFCGLRTGLLNTKTKCTIFEEVGIRPHGISIPRIHALQHYQHLVQQFGAPNGLCSSITESKHIDAVKKPWRRSNRHEALGQMLVINQRLDNIANFHARQFAKGKCIIVQ